MSQHKRHDSIIRDTDNEIVRDIKSQINDPKMQGVDYWLDTDNILDIKPIYDDGIIMGVHLIIGI